MGPTFEHLRRASAEDAATYFAGVDPEVLVREVRETSDDDLRDLIERDEIRRVAVEGILTRLHEYAVPERLAVLDGVVRFDLAGGPDLVERHALVVEKGTLKHLPDVGIDEPADVVLRTSTLRFVRLVSGERNAGLEYLAGRIDIEGDAALALAVGGIFKVPGTGEVAVDPTALDPVDVATALGGVSTDHLRRVMASGFRPVVLGEIVSRLPDFVNDRKARGADLTIVLRLLGRPDGGIDRYLVRVSGGIATVTEGDEGDEGSERDATVTCEAYEFLRLATGHLSAITGVLRGQLKIKGDKAKALQLTSVLDIPKAR